MMGVNYFKAEPTEFTRMSSNGKIKKEGQGISGFYMPFRTSIESISVASKDQPFIFSEISNDNQEVNVQGGIIYKIVEPQKALEQYDFSINPHNKLYLSDDHIKMPDHMVNIIQADARRIIQKTPLEKLLVMSEELSEEIFDRLKSSVWFSNLGTKLDTIYVTSISARTDIAKALEATYRENLLQKADEAIYARRAQGVEKERAIKENELSTKIELEEKKKKLVELKGQNIMQEAEFNTQAMKKQLEIYEGFKPEALTALALYEIGKNAERIGTLTITPDILSSIISGVKK